jgi:hypothetical protein
VLKIIACVVAGGVVRGRVHPTPPAAMPNAEFGYPGNTGRACASTNVATRAAHSLTYDASARRVLSVDPTWDASACASAAHERLDA